MSNTGPLDLLIKSLASLPGLGNRSARRIALHLLSQRSRTMMPLADLLRQAAEQVRDCPQCGNLDVLEPCMICQDLRRGRDQICVVSQVSDLWAIERTGSYKGQYQVLGGLLSALDGVGPEDLRIAQLIRRVQESRPQEVILALSATVDGQSTAHYIADRLQQDAQHPGLKITRLAHGVPVGGELDYLDDGTITTALRSRSVA